jgi:CheY-like chemotaxis protein
MARRVLETRFDVWEAGSGEEALRILETEAFHVVIVDVRLPGISGLDLLAAIKNLSPRTDVIVMTGSAVDIDEALEGAIRRRAFFFLRKPFPMTILETLAVRVSEKQDLEEQLERYTRTLERNLESARVFQRRLLPPPSWRGERIRIASHYQPSEQLGGDLVDYWSLPSGGTALLIVDVMGHGPLAAMLTGIVKSQVHSLASELHDPGDVLTALEEELGRIALPSFLSLLLVFDRPEDGETRWAGAGHPPGFLRTPALGPEVDRPLLISSEGILLNTGLPPEPRTSAGRPREAGSRLLLYTDGYPETLDRTGGIFEADPQTHGTSPADGGAPIGFSAAVRQALAAPTPEDGIHLLEEERNRFAGGLPSEDDRAALLAFLD